MDGICIQSSPEIQELSSAQWHHVVSEENPADLASREIKEEINNQINEVQDNNTKDVIAITDQQKEIDSHVITDIIEDVQDGNITTILLNNTIETSDHQEQTKRHIQSVETQSSIKNIEIIDYQEVTYSSINNVEVPPANIEIEITDYQEEIESTETHSANRGIENRVSDLQIEVSQLREENYKLKRKLTRKQKIILRQRRQNNNLSQVIRNFKLKQNKEAKKVVDQIIRNKLTDVFTSKQLDKILTKKQVRWTDEDISIAFTLRYLSKPCYLYLRNSLNYPLPGETTIHSWCSKVNMD
nr:uncharacterized protein LOC111419713 [Onthophagus taurus]